MQTRTEEEGAGLREDLALAPAHYALQVDVSVQEEMHWLVPFPVELLEGEGVPPVLVELPEVQPCHFCKEIAHILKDQVEAEDDEGCTGEHET